MVDYGSDMGASRSLRNWCVEIFRKDDGFVPMFSIASVSADWVAEIFRAKGIGGMAIICDRLA